MRTFTKKSSISSGKRIFKRTKCVVTGFFMALQRHFHSTISLSIGAKAKQVSISIRNSST